jgi:hypothetical protein
MPDPDPERPAGEADAARAVPAESGHAETSARVSGSARRLAICRALVRERRIVGQVFGFGLCADPAWDMLLDLYLAEGSGRAISLSSLCVASNVPATTALRCIREMGDRLLLIRRPDPGDARRIHVALSVEGRSALERLLDSVADTAPGRRDA